MSLVRGQNLIERLIASAVLAGAYRVLAKQEPAAQRGLLRMAEKHSENTAILAAQVGAGDARHD